MTSDAEMANWADHMEQQLVPLQVNLGSDVDAVGAASQSSAAATPTDVPHGSSAATNVNGASETPSYAGVAAASSHPDHPDNWANDDTAPPVFITDFERHHFHPENTLPDRPSSAYFRTDEFISTKDILTAIERDGIDIKSVRCLQRKPNNEVMITFSKRAIRDQFVEISSFHVKRRSYFVRSASTAYTYLTIYDAPHELPDSGIEERLAPFCTVKHKRRGRCEGYPDIFNGQRHYQVILKKPVPSFLRFGKFQLRFWHPNQPKTCRRCNLPDHLAKDCRAEICFNCDGIGHEANSCPSDVLCCI